MMLARLLTAALAPVVLWTLEDLARRERPPTDQSRIRSLSLVAGMVLVPVWDLVAVRTVHIDDAIALAASVGALAMARRDRPWWSAALIGLAVGAKPWAVAFLPILLLLRHHRTKAIVLAIVIGTIVWIPFLVAAPGTVEALRDFRLAVATRSALHLARLRCRGGTGLVAAGAVRRHGGRRHSRRSTRPLAGSDLRGDGDPHPARPRTPLLLSDRTRCRGCRLGSVVVRTKMAAVDHSVPSRALSTKLTVVPHGVAGAIRLVLSLTIIVAVLAGSSRRPAEYRDRGGQRWERSVVVSLAARRDRRLHRASSRRGADHRRTPRRTGVAKSAEVTAIP